MIALADCNNFFVSCELLKHPDLKGKSVCVLSNCDGCVISRSNEAKKEGIEMGIPLFKAKKEFPNAVYLSSDMPFYLNISERVRKIFRDFSPAVEVYSVDEAFMDVTDFEKLYNMSFEQIAKNLHERILKEVGIPVSVGIANSKILCKIAVDIAKKTSFYKFLDNKNIEIVLKNYPVEKIWGIGKNTSRKLRSFGLFTAGDMLRKDTSFFKFHFGVRGEELRLGLEGFNALPVKPFEEKPKSIQKTSSFTDFTNDKEFLKKSVLSHLHNACKKLRRYSLSAGIVGLMLRTKDFQVIYKTSVLEYNSSSEYFLNEKIIKLFNEIYNPETIYRSSGVGLFKLKDSEYKQLSLFDKNEKTDKIAYIIDKIEYKYGKNSLSIGNFTK